jgi:hypothetical protein
MPVGGIECPESEGPLLCRLPFSIRKARARGIENRPWGRDWRRGGSATAQVWRCSGGDRWHVGGWGRDWRRGGSAMPRWRGGGERVAGHRVVAVLALLFSPTTLARPARTRAPALPGHVVLQGPDGPMPFSTRRGAGVGRVPAALAGMRRPGLVKPLLLRRGYFFSIPNLFRTGSP